MDENRARITVMDKDRRISEKPIYLYFPRESNRIQSCWTVNRVKKFNFHLASTHAFSSPLFSNSGLPFLRA
jgi:hypothetical protein